MSNAKEDLARLSDKELLHLIAQKNKSAFTTFYNRYATDLYICVKQILLTRTEDDEQAGCDTQQILIAVFIPVLDDCLPIPAPESIGKYLFESARRMAHEYISQSKITL